MEFTINELAKLLKGTIDKPALGEVKLSKISKIEEGEEGSLCFLANMQYENFLYSCKASAVLVNNNFIPKKEISAALIKVENPYEAFATLLKLKEKAQSKVQQIGIHTTAVISKKAVIGKNVYIGAYVVIEDGTTIGDNCQIQPHCFIDKNCRIGNGTQLYSGVKIYHETILGDNCIIHAGSVVGSDGFGFSPDKNGTFQKIPQTGNVVVENNVEIGANCCIDRATIGSTLIKKGVKLDNFIQVAHNVCIGENTVIAAHSGISGSTKIGKNCMIGGQVGFAGHITVADGSKINAQSGISKSIKTPNKSWSGTPAREFRQHYKLLAYLGKIPNLIDRVKVLEKNE